MPCVMALLKESSHSRYLQLVSQLVTPDSLNSQGGRVDSLWRHYLMRYSLLSFLSWMVFSLCLPSAMIDVMSQSPLEEVQQEIMELHSNSPKPISHMDEGNPVLQNFIYMYQAPYIYQWGFFALIIPLGGYSKTLFLSSWQIWLFCFPLSNFQTGIIHAWFRPICSYASIILFSLNSCFPSHCLSVSWICGKQS